MHEDLNRTDRRYRDALTACAGIDTRIATAIVKRDYRSTTLGEMRVNYAAYVEYAAKRNGRDGKRKD